MSITPQINNKLSDMLTSDNNYDLIEAAAEMLSDKLYSIAYQTYKQLNLQGEMTDGDYNLIKKRILKELSED
jgi:hypothetical protein